MGMVGNSKSIVYRREIKEILPKVKPNISLEAMTKSMICSRDEGT